MPNFTNAPYTRTQAQTKRFVAKMPSLTCLHTLYYKTNMNTKYRCQNSHLYKCICPLQQQKDKRRDSFTKYPVLHVYLQYKKKFTINRKTCFQNSQSYILTYPLQQHKRTHKVLLEKFPVLYVYVPSTTTQT